MESSSPMGTKNALVKFNGFMKKKINNHVSVRKNDGRKGLRGVVRR